MGDANTQHSLKVTSQSISAAASSVQVNTHNINNNNINNNNNSNTNNNNNHNNINNNNNASCSKLQALKIKKQDLEKRLNDKNNLLQQLCRQESQLIGIYSSESRNDENESVATLRRKVGTSFKLPENLLNNKEKDDINKLLLEKQLQRQICEASLRLANDGSQTKSIRRTHKSNYESAYQKLQMLDQTIVIISKQQQQPLYPDHHQKLNAKSSSSVDDININNRNSKMINNLSKNVNLQMQINSNSCSHLDKSLKNKNSAPNSPNNNHTYTERRNSLKTSGLPQPQRRSMQDAHDNMVLANINSQTMASHQHAQLPFGHMHYGSNTPPVMVDQWNQLCYPPYAKNMNIKKATTFNGGFATLPNELPHYVHPPMSSNRFVPGDLVPIECPIMSDNNVIAGISAHKLNSPSNLDYFYPAPPQSYSSSPLTPTFVNQQHPFKAMQSYSSNAMQQLHIDVYSTKDHQVNLLKHSPFHPSQLPIRPHTVTVADGTHTMPLPSHVGKSSSKHKGLQTPMAGNSEGGGLGGHWVTLENNERTWCAVDNRFSSLDRKNKQLLAKKPVKNSPQPIKSTSLGNFDFIAPKNEEGFDTVSISSAQSENKKPKERVWCETSLDSPVLRPKSNTIRSQQQVYSVQGTNFYPATSIHPSNYDFEMMKGTQSVYKVSPGQQCVVEQDMYPQQFLNYPPPMPPPHIKYSHNEFDGSNRTSLNPPAEFRDVPVLIADHIGAQMKRSSSSMSTPSAPSPKTQTAASSFSNPSDIRIESPKNVTVVQQAKFLPYKEVTKPFEMSDFYKYSTKFRQKTASTVQAGGGGGGGVVSGAGIVSPSVDKKGAYPSTIHSANQ